ncbi:hypothetical protein OPQ81_003799 [Rhizoctonia solani]|nr:hypothetical protein OPQ81_003799 [Rhizoctonia solani]
MYCYAIGIVFTLISWLKIAIFTIYFISPYILIPEDLFDSFLSPLLCWDACRFTRLGEAFVHKYLAALLDNFIHRELVDPADTADLVYRISTPPSAPLPAKPPPLQSVLDIAAGTNGNDVAPFADLPSTSTLLEMTDMSTTQLTPRSGRESRLLIRSPLAVQIELLFAVRRFMDLSESWTTGVYGVPPRGD